MVVGIGVGVGGGSGGLEYLLDDFLVLGVLVELVLDLADDVEDLGVEDPHELVGVDVGVLHQPVQSLLDALVLAYVLVGLLTVVEMDEHVGERLVQLVPLLLDGALQLVQLLLLRERLLLLWLLVLLLLLLVLVVLVVPLHLLLDLAVVLLPVLQAGQQLLHVLLLGHVLVQGLAQVVHLVVVDEWVHRLSCSVDASTVAVFVILVAVGGTVGAVAVVAGLVTAGGEVLRLVVVVLGVLGVYVFLVIVDLLPVVLISVVIVMLVEVVGVFVVLLLI